MAQELKEVRDEQKIMIGIMERQAMMIDHLQGHNERLQQKALRNNLIIQGLIPDENDNNPNLTELVTNFFTQVMKIRRNVAIRSVIRLGTGKTATLQVTLDNIRDKGIIFKNVKQLSGLKNKNDDSYFVNDQLTFERQEEQCRQRDIKKHNASLPVTERASVVFKKGDLLINNSKYIKAVHHPGVRDVVQPDDMEKINDLYQTEGENIRNGKCRFIAISQEISTLKDVRMGYIKARRRHPDALHVVCAYNLPGSNIAVYSDFDSNKEAGAGRNLLDLLTKHGIIHRALYVARYYGGDQLGASRFQSYRDAAISAISRSSYNSIIAKNQFPLHKIPTPATSDRDHQTMVGYAKAASPTPYNAVGKTVTSVASPQASSASGTTAAAPSYWSGGSWSDQMGKADEGAFRSRANSFPSLPSKKANLRTNTHISTASVVTGAL